MTDTFRDLIIRTSKDKEEAEFRTVLHEALAEFAFNKNEEGKMNDDLVKRLRRLDTCIFPTERDRCHCGEAADRIEKLEAALRDIIVTLDSEEIPYMVRNRYAYATAKEAVEGKDE